MENKVDPFKAFKLALDLLVEAEAKQIANTSFMVERLFKEKK